MKGLPHIVSSTSCIAVILLRDVYMRALILNTSLTAACSCSKYLERRDASMSFSVASTEEGSGSWKASDSDVNPRWGGFFLLTWVDAAATVDVLVALAFGGVLCSSP